MPAEEQARILALLHQIRARTRCSALSRRRRPPRRPPPRPRRPPPPRPPRAPGRPPRPRRPRPDARPVERPSTPGDHDQPADRAAVRAGLRHPGRRPGKDGGRRRRPPRPHGRPRRRTKGDRGTDGQARPLRAGLPPQPRPPVLVRLRFQFRRHPPFPVPRRPRSPWPSRTLPHRDRGSSGPHPVPEQLPAEEQASAPRRSPRTKRPSSRRSIRSSRRSRGRRGPRRTSRTPPVPTLATFRPVVNTLPDGTLVFVESQRSWYRSDLAGNVYRRESFADPTWMLQAAWGLDTVNGNDENVGSVASPVKTVAEFVARLPQLSQSLIASTVAAGSAIPLFVWQPVIVPGAGNITITIQGVVTLGANQTVTASTNTTALECPSVNVGAALVPNTFRPANQRTGQRRDRLPAPRSSRARTDAPPPGGAPRDRSSPRPGWAKPSRRSRCPPARSSPSPCRARSTS